MIILVFEFIKKYLKKVGEYAKERERIENDYNGKRDKEISNIGKKEIQVQKVPLGSEQAQNEMNEELKNLEKDKSVA